MTAAAHSRFAPSSALRWLRCPGSVQMVEQVANPLDSDTDASVEGTAAHWVAEQVVHGKPVQLGQIAPNGVAVSQDMLDGAQLWADYLETIAPLDQWGIEQPMRIPTIHADCYGTPDAVCWVGDTLHVADYKFGHREVTPVHNPQLEAYAAGAAAGRARPLSIELHIVQPRCYTVRDKWRHWRTVWSEIEAAATRMRGAAVEAGCSNPSLRVGPHCEYCPARHLCPQLAKEAAGVADRLRWEPPLDLAPEQIGRNLDALEQAATLLGALIDGQRQHAEQLIRSGRNVPGWGMVPGRSVTEWAVPLDDVLALGDMMGVSLVKPPAPITPSQAMTAVKRMGIDADAIRAYCSTTPGALKLAPVDTNQSEQVFQNGN